MKLKTLGCALVLASAVISVQAFAGEGKHGNPKPLEGCYTVTRGGIQESPANTDVIGTHHLVLVQEGNSKHKQKRIEISGPLGGREDRNAHEEEGEEGEENPAEMHGQHAFGTFDRSGVLLSFESDSGVTGLDCFNAQGIPNLIYGFETMTFYGGTGAYSGLSHGHVRFEGSFDRCTEPGNPKADFRVASGEICFGGEEGEE